MKGTTMAMSDAHKEALAQGRKESRIVKAYLEALRSRRPGRPVTPESVRERIGKLDERLNEEGDSLKRLDLIQAKLDAEEQLADVSESVDIDAREKEFAQIAKSYSERKGISYSAWRQIGVPASVLKRASIPRTRRI
jgi:hypothetical protein